jgi:maltooligosyltrehalose trehalohydrolase
VRNRLLSTQQAMSSFGANVVVGGICFQVWAPKADTVDVEIIDREERSWWPLDDRGNGVFAGRVPRLGAGARYRYRLDGGLSYPDPWSRSQPEGVHGPSEVVDPSAFRWTDESWPGIERDRLVLYEVHVGAYTPEGTFDALVRELTEIYRLGVTVVELMPVAEFAGRRNWGYDGVFPFAPSRNYGGVEGLKRFVDAAHRVGIGVFLDVVYNHLGPEGNYLRVYSDDYFTRRRVTPWGEAMNFDGPNSRFVRDFVIQNACYWLREYHLDGLRLDATHAIFDDSPMPILAALSTTVGAQIGCHRRVYLFAEDARNDVQLVRPVTEGGMGLDGVWADDFHHSVHTLVTGEREGYYVDYDGSAHAVARVITTGFLYQGEHSDYRGGPRGTPVTDEPASAFVFCIQNHDQIGNRAFGERLNHLVDPEIYAVASVLLLLSPEIPLLFMGQEFAASSPFLYFTDHHDRLGRLVTEGRRKEFARFEAFSTPDARELIPDPQAEETFLQSKLDLGERSHNAQVYDLYRELLHLRQTDAVFSRPDRQQTETAALGDRCILLRRWADGRRRLVVANFGPGFTVGVSDVPMLDWLLSGTWRIILSTDEFQQSNRRDTPPALESGGLDDGWGASGRHDAPPEASATRAAAHPVVPLRPIDNSAERPALLVGGTSVCRILIPAETAVVLADD